MTPEPNWAAKEATAACRRLTPREREILVLTCKGLTARDVGAHLGIAWRTVEFYRRSIYRKLEVNSSVEAAVLAVKAGLA